MHYFVYIASYLGKMFVSEEEIETFVTKGFKLWNQKEKLNSHFGGVNSAHNQAFKKSEDLMKEKQHIQSVLVKQSN